MGWAAVAASAVQALGSIQQGNASAAAAGYNAKVAQNNATIANQNASFAGAVGEQNTASQEEKTRATVGAIKANQGASGVDVNTGSAEQVRESAAKVGMFNALEIRSQAARQAYGYQTQAANDTAQVQLDKMQAKSDRTAGYIGAAGDVLGGVGKAAEFGNFLSSTDPTGGISTWQSGDSFGGSSNDQLISGNMSNDTLYGV